MLKKLIPWVLLALCILPEFAMASTLNPINGNAWTLYVFGNGDAIFHILESIKLLMIPDSGETGFNSLLMFLATLGFLILAIQAGFDPGKNLMKMFSYIIVVASVHIMTLQLTANIEVKDAVTNYDNVSPGVPALVGVPAAIVSEVGHWFTKTVETYYTIPSEMTVSGGSFNLFGRLMQESNEYVISDVELKKSLSAYTADCVIPAMAMGNLSAADLMTSGSMVSVLKKATHEAILTKYWPRGIPNTSGIGIKYPESISYSGIDYPVQGGLGAVLPCGGAWAQLEKEMNAHAQELMDASAKQWSKTGVLVPFETAMSSALAMASSGGGNSVSNYSKPNGYILQQALLNSMNGSFRTAAATIGNNDVLMAASIAQAEQSQKTSWFTAARVFTNMMGYVYTTLQAFIFAIVPVVIIALMVPGLGKPIFTNYSQILVWLMLWQPMLSIVNYLITLFGQAQVASTLELANGVSMQNKAILTENTNDLMLAAQFLGTSVPLLTWGLVKGSLAFTEFISHGIGSSMAQQAGVTAATGNMSMNNMSMDNTSMNKFNTAFSSAVGAQSTMGYTGAMQTSFDSGGVSTAENGAAKTKMESVGLSSQAVKALGNAASYQLSAAENLTNALNLSRNNQSGESNSQIQALTISAVDSLQKGFTEARSSGNQEAIDSSRSAVIDASNTALTQLEAKIQAQGGVALDSDRSVIGKIAGYASGWKASISAGVSGSLGGSAATAIADRATKALGYKAGGSTSDSKGTQDSGAHADSRGLSNTHQVGTSREQSYGESYQKGIQQALNTSASLATNAASTSQYTASHASTTQQAVRVSEFDSQSVDRVDAVIAHDAVAIGGNVNSAISGAPETPKTFAEQRSAYDKFDKQNPAGGAPKALASHPLNTGKPTEPENPLGIDFKTKVDSGRTTAETAYKSQTTANTGVNADLATKQKTVETTNVVDVALNHGDKRVRNAVAQLENAEQLVKKSK